MHLNLRDGLCFPPTQIVFHSKRKIILFFFLDMEIIIVFFKFKHNVFVDYRLQSQIIYVFAYFRSNVFFHEI